MSILENGRMDGDDRFLINRKGFRFGDCLLNRSELNAAASDEQIVLANVNRGGDDQLTHEYWTAVSISVRPQRAPSIAAIERCALFS